MRSIHHMNPEDRFSNRVANYAKYRPGYPQELISYLKNECNVKDGDVVADIGSGTGIFSRMLLDAGFEVFAVEPNEAMRQFAEADFTDKNLFHSIDGTSENTRLKEHSVDLIVCAQAFHWFDVQKTQHEFNRILKPGKTVALIWNNRLTDADDFARAYENLLHEKGTDYTEVNHAAQPVERFKAFFKDGNYTFFSMPNRQEFDFEGLAGRVFSSSYVPEKDTEAGKEFERSLHEIFEKYNQNGQVSFVYDTLVYVGKV